MLVFTGFMIALAVVLSKLVSINISFLRIGFGFLPIAVLAILYGPYVAAIGYGIADLLGAWLFPTGTFFPGFTVSAVLTGLIFGWVLYKKEVTFVRALIASALVCLTVNLLLNTWWLTFIIGKGFTLHFHHFLIRLHALRQSSRGYYDFLLMVDAIHLINLLHILRHQSPSRKQKSNYKKQFLHIQRFKIQDSKIQDSRI